MEPNDEVQDYLELSEEYLRSAARDVEEGLFAPARLSLQQALELGLKAALMARTGTTGEDWTKHNVHGASGKHFRGHVEDAALARISRLVQEYGKSRNPGGETPTQAQTRDDLAFIQQVLHETNPRLLREVCG